MCRKDMRQELHMLMHTQGPDGLLHLYNRLETGGRVLLLCLLCTEAGWLILVNAWLRLERAYRKMRLFLRVEFDHRFQRRRRTGTLRHLSTGSIFLPKDVH